MESLSSAMSKLALQRSSISWGGSVRGTPAASSCVGMVSLGSPPTGQVQIRWRYILLDVVQRMGGTEPEYTCEDTTDGMYEVRIRFSLSVSGVGISSTDIVVVGGRCSSSSEAENEASVQALKELEHGCISIRIMDFSGLCCKDLEKQCHQAAAKAHILYQGVKEVLLEWKEDLHKTEVCYSPNRNIRDYNTSGDICLQLAEHLAELTKENNMKMEELIVETERAKIFTDNVVARGEHGFCETCPYQADKQQGRLAQEIQLSMKLVLQEMSISLGWACPVHKVMSTRDGVYLCETSLFLKHGEAGRKDDMLAVMGFEDSSNEIAVESSCKAAISILENEKSIWLVDLNLKHRLYREMCALDSKKAVQLLFLVGSKVLGQWKSMANDLLACQRCSQEVMRECSVGQDDMLWKMERNANALGVLHSVFLIDLEAAEQQLNNMG